MHIKKKYFVALFVVLLLSKSLFAIEINQTVLVCPEKVKRGESAFAVLALDSPCQNAWEYTLKITYSNNKKSPVFTGWFNSVEVNPSGHEILEAKNSKQWEAVPNSKHFVYFLFAVPTNAALGSASVFVNINEQNVCLANIEIVDRKFDVEILRLDPVLTSIRADPDPVKTEQAVKYQKIIANVDKEASYLDSGFVFPLPSRRVTTEFGWSRKYEYSNGKSAWSTHAGLDYGGKTGTPVCSPAKGRVVMAENRIVTGNTVIIEHLPGTYSIYMHLDSLLVENGNIVSSGEKIGTVGATGLATGPHLHWEFRVMGISSDPEVLLGIDKVPSIRKIVSVLEGR